MKFGKMFQIKKSSVLKYYVEQYNFLENDYFEKMKWHKKEIKKKNVLIIGLELAFIALLIYTMV